VATGRTPVTAQLGLESAGVDLTERGFISVDSHLRTTADHVWAAGDVAGTPQFTHASWHDFRILKANFDHENAVTTGRIVPYTVFITPELARVGLTEAQARAQGHNVAIGKIPVSAIPGQDTARHDRHLEGGRGRRHRLNPWCGAAWPQRRRSHFLAADGYARGASVPAGPRCCAHPSHHGRRAQPALRCARRSAAEASWPEISSPDTKQVTVGSAAPAMPQSIRISLRSPDQRVWKVPTASVR
jgi:Pyridine nucleotide-disulphide oxidoreductase/Pyridine nucleotide-disulphide oxidoreductase, dimerisation domain